MPLNRDMLKSILLDCKPHVDKRYLHKVLEAAFPPKFIPNDDEVVWVRTNDQDVYRLRVFKYMDDNGHYVVLAEGRVGKEVTYKIAMAQTPTQKGL
jgi:hypothetical protein